MVQVIVNYNDVSDISKIISQINDVENPHIVLWYIGTNGLKKSSVAFYRQLIAPIYTNNFNAIFWLYDLTAWGALKNPNLSIIKRSRHVQKISDMDSNRIKCLTAADIFNKMRLITDQQIINYLGNALSRKFIWQASLNACLSGIMIKTLFKNNCPLLTKYYDYDANRGYSMLQYLEGCLLIDEIVKIVLHPFNQKDLQIFFVLPNDEIKYYKDETNAFKKDIEFLINHLHNFESNEIKVIINFFPFKYGNLAHERPYHGPERVVSSNELQDIHMISKNN
jgi:hypothetical protein